MRTSSSANTPVQVRPAVAVGEPGGWVETPRLVHLVGLVVLGRRVAVTLAGDAVHDHRTVEAARQPERVLHRRDVVPVDRSDVLQPEVLEHALRRQHVLHAALHAVQRLVERRPDDRDPRQVVLHAAEHALVARAQPEPGQVLGERRRSSARRNGRCR